MKNKINHESNHNVDTLLSMIPMGNAGCCVSCDRIFTIIRNQSICPGCGSTAWWPVKHWLNKGAA